jgi:uncharacterized membrane protein YbhN (UPF0104 family)
MAAYAGSLILPARAGEALRVWLLKRRDGVPVTSSTGVAISEKLVDGCAMILSVTPTLFLIDGLPAWVGRTIAVLVGGAAVGLTVALVARRWARPEGLVGKLTQGMTAFATPMTFALALAACLGAWMSDFTCVLLVLSAVGVKVPAAVGLLILLGVNAALDLVGVPQAPAMAFAILYHAVQAIPLLVAGVADIRLLLWARRGEEAEAARALTVTEQ